MVKGKKRYPGRNHHHLTPRRRGGADSDRNLLLIDITKHECWHKIFGIRTLDETIGLLNRLKRAKGGKYEAFTRAVQRLGTKRGNPIF